MPFNKSEKNESFLIIFLYKDLKNPQLKFQLFNESNGEQK